LAARISPARLPRRAPQRGHGRLCGGLSKRRSGRRADLAGEFAAPALRGADAGGGPGEAAALLGERQRALGEVAACGGGQRGDLGLEPAILAREPVEAGKVAGLPRVHQALEVAQRGRGHGRSPPRARAAARILSEKRIAAATAR
jgi:hypothetical protein